MATRPRSPIVLRVVREMLQYKPEVRAEVIAALKDEYCYKCGHRSCDCVKPGRPKKVQNVKTASA